MIKNKIKRWLGIDNIDAKTETHISILENRLKIKRNELQNIIGDTIIELCNNIEDGTSDIFDFNSKRNKFLQTVKDVACEGMDNKFNEYVNELNRSEEFLDKMIDRIKRKQLK